MPYNYQNLPADDNVTSYSYSIEVQGEMFVQKGKMIAYYGQLRFEALGTSQYSAMVTRAFNAPAYAGSFAIVTGRGKLILGDNGNHIASYKLEQGNLTVKAENVLGFSSTLRCLESTMPGFLTLIGNGTFLASSNGAVHFLEPPVNVDPDALLGWADCPCPSYHYDYSHIRNVLEMMGTITGFSASGEERQLEFGGQGNVLVQSSEEPLAGRGLLQRMLGDLPGLGTNDLQELGMVISQKLRGG